MLPLPLASVDHRRFGTCRLVQRDIASIVLMQLRRLDAATAMTSSGDVVVDIMEVIQP